MDLTLKSEEGMVNIRVGAIIKSNDGYCFHFDKKHQFHALIGGRIKYYESSDSAIKREIKEELGIECDNIHFLTTIQNFYEYQGTSMHEILFIYNVTIQDSFKNLNLIPDSKVDYVCVKLEDIPQIHLLPEKVKEIILRRIDIQPLFIDRDNSK